MKSCCMLPAHVLYIRHYITAVLHIKVNHARTCTARLTSFSAYAHWFLVSDCTVRSGG
jgi:hypothetical protein